MKLVLRFTYELLNVGIKYDPWVERTVYFGAIDWPAGYRFPQPDEAFYFHPRVDGRVYSLKWHVYPEETILFLEIQTSCPEAVMREEVRQGRLHEQAPLESLLFPY